MAKRAAWFPSWVQSVDAMIGEALEIRAFCDRKCMPYPGYAVVNLERIRDAKGGDYSLINRRTRCKTPSCGGWIKFHYLHGVYRPLFDEETALRWMFK